MCSERSPAVPMLRRTATIARALQLGGGLCQSSLVLRASCVVEALLCFAAGFAALVFLLCFWSASSVWSRFCYLTQLFLLVLRLLDPDTSCDEGVVSPAPPGLPHKHFTPQ